MNFGTWKININKKEQLEFLHKNPNNGEFELVKKFKPPLKHKLKKSKKFNKKNKEANK